MTLPAPASDFTVAPLSRADLPVDTVEMARSLVGKTLTHERPEGRTSGRIVETEAYPIGDPAAHHFVGLTRRNRSLFRERGHCYVYLGYGVSWLANVSSESDGIGAGVLLRALEPLEGIELMRERRGRERLVDLASGPGKLCMAMDIHRGQDGLDLCGDSSLWLGHAVRPVGEIGISVRIGITKAADKPWRFFERGSAFLSGPRKLNL
ncbi:MAG TPA: DNA-3-methyladenine glycosylase [Caulobacteraceae bacterium]